MMACSIPVAPCCCGTGIFIVIYFLAPLLLFGRRLLLVAVKSCAVEKPIYICQSKIVQWGIFGKSSEHHIDNVILHYIVYTVIVYKFLATCFSLLFFHFHFRVSLISKDAKILLFLC